MSVVSRVNDDPSASYAAAAGDLGSKGPENKDLWIHRDKLAQIEGNEAVDYRYDVGQSRWIHKDKLERIEIEELARGGGEQYSNQSRGVYGETSNGNSNRQHKSSPDEYYDDEDPMRDADFNELRTPEEQAADWISSPRKNFNRNPSYSRIPLASLSPHPIPQQFIERTTPLPRSSVTPNGSDDGGVSISPPSLRKRSHSASSAMLLDDQESSPTAGAASAAAVAATRSSPTPTTSSAPASSKKRPSVTAATAARPKQSSRASGTSTVTKPRAKSNAKPTHRPGTSASYSAHGGQNAPNKSPEGRPPWSLSGYKADPSLPPDQQIIPTLARKLQQEQWERDGVPATVYDKEMRPLMVEDGPDREREKSPVCQEDGGESEEMGAEWPLRSTSQAEPSESKRSTEQHIHKSNSRLEGGYRTTPSVSFGWPICVYLHANLYSRFTNSRRRILLAQHPKSNRCLWWTKTAKRRRNSAAASSCRQATCGYYRKLYIRQFLDHREVSNVPFVSLYRAGLHQHLSLKFFLSVFLFFFSHSCESGPGRVGCFYFFSLGVFILQQLLLRSSQGEDRAYPHHGITGNSCIFCASPLTATTTTPPPPPPHHHNRRPLLASLGCFPNVSSYIS